MARPGLWIPALVLLSIPSGCSVDDEWEYQDLQGVTRHPLDPGDAKASVLIFITVDCPIANGYSPTIQEMLKDYAEDPVQFHLVHIERGLSVERATRHAEDYSLDCPILIDTDRRLVKYTGVSITPEAAVYDRAGNLVYRGRIDNWYGDIGAKRPQPTKHDLRDAIDAVLADKEVAVTRTDAVGCYIEG